MLMLRWTSQLSHSYVDCVQMMPALDVVDDAAAFAVAVPAAVLCSPNLNNHTKEDETKLIILVAAAAS